MIAAGIATVVFMLIAGICFGTAFVKFANDDDDSAAVVMFVGWISGVLASISGFAFIIFAVIEVINKL